MPRLAPLSSSLVVLIRHLTRTFSVSLIPPSSLLRPSICVACSVQPWRQLRKGRWCGPERCDRMRMVPQGGRTGQRERTGTHSLCTCIAPSCLHVIVVPVWLSHSLCDVFAVSVVVVRVIEWGEVKERDVKHHAHQEMQEHRRTQSRTLSPFSFLPSLSLFLSLSSSL